MSFRDNMQHLRATRNMTQEQLAMLLGVSRQSVSKWEAERAYPEMDKLLKMCVLFECTLDELVTGDLTGRPANGAASIPPGKSQQDVTGYDQAMRVFAWKLPLGISVILASAALALLLSDPGLMPIAEVRSFASALVFVGAAVGLALILPASFARGAFRKAHPFVDDFYTADQKSKARTALSTGLVAGIGLLMAGLAATIVLQADVWLASATFLAFAAVGVFVIVRSALLGALQPRIARRHERGADRGYGRRRPCRARPPCQARTRHLRSRYACGDGGRPGVDVHAGEQAVPAGMAGRRPRVPCDQGVPFCAKRRLGVTRGSSQGGGCVLRRAESPTSRCP